LTDDNKLKVPDALSVGREINVGINGIVPASLRFGLILDDDFSFRDPTFSKRLPYHGAGIDDIGLSAAVSRHRSL
jgi:hypothetical protein